MTNKLHRYAFLHGKTNHRKHHIHGYLLKKNIHGSRKHAIDVHDSLNSMHDSLSAEAS